MVLQCSEGSRWHGKSGIKFWSGKVPEFCRWSRKNDLCGFAAQMGRVIMPNTVGEFHCWNSMGTAVVVSVFYAPFDTLSYNHFGQVVLTQADEVALLCCHQRTQRKKSPLSSKNRRFVFVCAYKMAAPSLVFNGEKNENNVLESYYIVVNCCHRQCQTVIVFVLKKKNSCP